MKQYPKYEIISKTSQKTKVVKINKSKLVDIDSSPLPKALPILDYNSKLDGYAYWLPAQFDWQIVRTEMGGLAVVPTQKA